jgi:predicted protein tyrosine phosphatase
MEDEHKLWITTRFEGLELPKIDVLEIPDEYMVMDPELQETLRSLLDPEFEHLVSARRKSGR